MEQRWKILPFEVEFAFVPRFAWSASSFVAAALPSAPNETRADRLCLNFVGDQTV